jgi:hypothetical protein
LYSPLTFCILLYEDISLSISKQKGTNMQRLHVSIAIGGISIDEAKRVGLLDSVIHEDEVEAYSTTTLAEEESFLSFAKNLYRRAVEKGLAEGVQGALIAGTITRLGK